MFGFMLLFEVKLKYDSLQLVDIIIWIRRATLNSRLQHGLLL